MNKWQENRLKEFCDFYGWPVEDTRKMFENSREFFELVWLGMNPTDQRLRSQYYNGPWLTLRQMSYDRGDALPQYVISFIDEMQPAESLLDYGCGVGDGVLYAASRGVLAHAVEVPSKIPFLRFRAERVGVAIKTYYPAAEWFHQKYHRATLLSVLDHVEDPVDLANKVVSCTTGPILASPRIDESYDRPTHEKEILKHVPEAFEILDRHNQRINYHPPAEIS